MLRFESRKKFLQPFAFDDAVPVAAELFFESSDVFGIRRVQVEEFFDEIGEMVVDLESQGRNGFLLIMLKQVVFESIIAIICHIGLVQLIIEFDLQSFYRELPDLFVRGSYGVYLAFSYFYHNFTEAILRTIV